MLKKWNWPPGGPTEALLGVDAHHNYQMHIFTLMNTPAKIFLFSHMVKIEKKKKALGAFLFIYLF